MSRNLCSTTCHFCNHPVVMVGAPRQFDYTGSVYYEELQTMVVCDAECPVCLAQYLAWVSPPFGCSGIDSAPESTAPASHYDLSFRSTFNAEPGDQDLPRYKVKVTTLYKRIGAYGDRPSISPEEYKAFQL